LAKNGVSRPEQASSYRSTGCILMPNTAWNRANWRGFSITLVKISPQMRTTTKLDMLKKCSASIAEIQTGPGLPVFQGTAERPSR